MQNNSDPEEIVIFILFAPSELPSLNSKEEDLSLGLMYLFILLCNLNSSPFLLGVITELHKDHDMKFLWKNKDAKEDSEYLVKGSKG